ncbi:MAG: ribonuclease P protein component [Spirochaetales bacterium]|nr:MAG: ribonuclease P protein component [Spirochaetales bacterium]
MRKNLSKNERINKRGNIRRLFTGARRFSGDGVKLLITANQLETNRILISITRSYGNAVSRNRAKRIIREIFRTTKTSVITGYDLGFIVYPGELTYGERKEQILLLYKKAGILLPTAE